MSDPAPYSSVPDPTVSDPTVPYLGALSDRPHDLGGRVGFGPVPLHATRAWSAHWQQLSQVLASMTARAAGVNGDALRDVMERLPAEEYHRLGPCGRWLAVAERCALEGGLIADGEVVDRARRRAAREEPRPVADYPEPGPSRFSGGVPPHHKRDPTEGPDPLFQPGDAVLLTPGAPPATPVCRLTFGVSGAGW